VLGLKLLAHWCNLASKPALALLGALVAVVAAGSGYTLHQADRREKVANLAIRQMLAMTLPDARGAPQSFGQWKGKVLVVNFWATWCDPCREEIPGLMRLRKKYISKNVEIVGIAVDYASKVGDYEKTIGIDYPLLVGGLESIDLARSLGDKQGGLPYTLVLDRSGKLAMVHLGLMHETDLDQKLAELSL
jgi:thiol-disulfide isomerase/thioredoxin